MRSGFGEMKCEVAGSVILGEGLGLGVLGGYGDKGRVVGYLELGGGLFSEGLGLEFFLVRS